MTQRQQLNQQQALSNFLAAQTGSTVSVKSMERLSGGAIQQNYRLRVDVASGPYQGDRHWVLRQDADSSIRESLTRPQEFQLLSYAHQHQVKVPKPLWCGDSSILGVNFFIMEWVDGITRPAWLTNPKKFQVDRQALTRQLGSQLGAIHNLAADERIAFLQRPSEHPALPRLRQYRDYLHSLSESYPILELSLLKLLSDIDAMPMPELVISHRDFRTGNLMVAPDGLTAILDWEFCGWSDPHEDIAWFCAPCWRFAGIDQAAGGIGERAWFYQAYQETTQRQINPQAVAFWQMFATLRWAVIAIEQGYRHLDGEASLELALTAHIVPELEWDLLQMLEENTKCAHPSVQPCY